MIDLARAAGPWIRPFCAIAAALGTSASGATAQQQSTIPSLEPQWVREIGLAGIGSLARSAGILPHREPLTLQTPGRPLGMAGFAGNPAGLPWEVDAGAAELRTQYRTTSGEYRRPLDPIRSQSSVLGGKAWGSIDDRRSAEGSARIGHTLMEPAGGSLALAPYSGNPFLTTDAERPDLRTIDAAFNGALGVRIGSWGIGFGAAYAAAEQRTIAHSVHRYTRDTEYVAAAGVVRAFRDGGVRVGLHARAGGGAAVNAVASLTSGTEVRTLIGYTEPEPVILPLPGIFHRRTRRTLTELTGTLALDRTGFTWIAFASAARLSEEMTRQRLAAPDDPHEAWDVRRFTSGAGLALSNAAGSWLLLGRHERESGEGSIPDVNEVVFATTDDHVRASLTWRPPLQGESLRTAFRAGLTYVNRRQQDRLSRMYSELSAWTTSAGAEGFWSPRRQVEIALGYTFDLHEPSGRLPSPGRFGPSTHDLVGRELGYYFTPARVHSVAVALTWRAALARLTLEAEHSRATAATTDRRFDIHPQGSRAATTVGLRFSPGR